MTILKAKDYNTRKLLENKVKALVSLDTKHKPDFFIQGTKEELAHLMLSNRSWFWGIICQEIDDKNKVVVKEQKQIPRPNRGKIHNSSLNGKINKNKK